MRRSWKSAWTACGAVLLVISCSAALSAAPPCDEFDPFGPTRSAQIRLDAGDLLDEDGTEMRSFIATDSIGRVDVAVVGSVPGDAVRAVSAVPEISMFSPHYGEQLKGIHVAVSLAGGRQPVSVVLDLRQVCAKHFRNTFLYY